MSASKHEEIRLGQLAIRYLLEGTETNGSLAMFEFEVGAGAKVPVAHSHDAYEETCYGLEGVLTFTIEGQRREIGPGDFALIPRGAVHRFDNFSSAPAKALAVITPGILSSDFFREVGAVLNAAAGGPPDHAAIAAVMKRHGLTAAP
jgi:quercetin dioxygenase-like cupin family protein